MFSLQFSKWKNNLECCLTQGRASLVRGEPLPFPRLLPPPYPQPPSSPPQPPPDDAELWMCHIMSLLGRVAVRRARKAALLCVLFLMVQVCVEEVRQGPRAARLIAPATTS